MYEQIVRYVDPKQEAVEKVVEKVFRVPHNEEPLKTFSELIAKLDEIPSVTKK